MINLDDFQFNRERRALSVDDFPNTCSRGTIVK